MNKSNYISSVGIYLNGKDMNPDGITTALRVKPSFSRHRGDYWVTSTTRKSGIVKAGVWSLTTDSNYGAVSNDITQLLSQFPSDRKIVSELEGIDNSFFDIFVAGGAYKKGGGLCKFDLSRENITALARTGLPLFMTISVTDE
jgi:hypothetical protein